MTTTVSLSPSPSKSAVAGMITPIRHAQEDMITRQKKSLEVRARGMVTQFGPPQLPGLGRPWEELKALPESTWAKQMGTLTTLRLLNDSPRSSILSAAGRSASMSSLSPAAEMVKRIADGGPPKKQNPPKPVKPIVKDISILKAAPPPQKVKAQPSPGGHGHSSTTEATVMLTKDGRRDIRFMPAAGEMGSFPLKSGMGNNRPMFHVPMPRPEG